MAQTHRRMEKMVSPLGSTQTVLMKRRKEGAVQTFHLHAYSFAYLLVCIRARLHILLESLRFSAPRQRLLLFGQADMLPGAFWLFLNNGQFQFMGLRKTEA